MKSSIRTPARSHAVQRADSTNPRAHHCGSLVGTVPPGHRSQSPLTAEMSTRPGARRDRDRARHPTQDAQLPVAPAFGGPVRQQRTNGRRPPRSRPRSSGQSRRVRAFVVLARWPGRGLGPRPPCPRSRPASAFGSLLVSAGRPLGIRPLHRLWAIHRRTGPLARDQRTAPRRARARWRDLQEGTTRREPRSGRRVINEPDPQLLTISPSAGRPSTRALTISGWLS